jgi:hypothetical protein
MSSFMSANQTDHARVDAAAEKYSIRAPVCLPNSLTVRAIFAGLAIMVVPSESGRLEYTQLELLSRNIA